MRRFDRKDRKRADAESAPLDPIALTLALWLGLVVGVTSLIRLSETAAANAARVQAEQRHGLANPGLAAPIRPAAMTLTPIGT